MVRTLTSVSRHILELKTNLITLEALGVLQCSYTTMNVESSRNNIMIMKCEKIGNLCSLVGNTLLLMELGSLHHRNIHLENE